VWTSRRGSCRTSCRTLQQGRRPDVSYLTVELLEQFGEAAALPQSPLIEMTVFSTDSAEELPKLKSI